MGRKQQETGKQWRKSVKPKAGSLKRVSKTDKTLARLIKTEKIEKEDTNQQE